MIKVREGRSSQGSLRQSNTDCQSTALPRGPLSISRNLFMAFLNVSILLTNFAAALWLIAILMTVLKTESDRDRVGNRRVL